MPLVGYARVSTADQPPLAPAARRPRNQRGLRRGLLRIINGPPPKVRRWTQSRLQRALNADVRYGVRPEVARARAGRRQTDGRLPVIVVAITGADPDITFYSQTTGGDARSDKLTAVIRKDV